MLGLKRADLAAAHLVAAQGMTNKEAGRVLEVEYQTVKNSMHRVYDKTGAHTRLQLAVYFQSNLEFARSAAKAFVERAQHTKGAK